MINLANRDNMWGLLTNIVLAMSFAAFVNAIIFSRGWNRSGDYVIQPSFAPPDYMIGVVWVFLFACMATARWLIIKSKSEKAVLHSRLVVLLVVFCALFPFYSLAFDSTTGGLIGCIATLLLAGWIVYQVKSSSRAAAALVFTVILWLSFATVIIIRLIQFNA